MIGDTMDLEFPLRRYEPFESAEYELTEKLNQNLNLSKRSKIETQLVPLGMSREIEKASCFAFRPQRS